MYFVFSLIALLCWSGSDIFSKVGTCQKDKLSQWRVIFAVGVIMGIHAILTIILSAFIDVSTMPAFLKSVIYTDFKIIDFIHYLPVAFIYLSAMVIGYMGLRYIELSVSSPICNSSGSVAFVVCVILGIAGLSEMNTGDVVLTVLGVFCITFGIIFLGITEYKEDDEVKLARQNETLFKYQKSFIAILIPVIYLFMDALGTVGDQIISEKGLFEISEYASNTAFELTSLLFALFAIFFVKVIKKEKFFSFLTKQSDSRSSINKFLILGGLCETVGQMFYMSVMFSSFSAGMPIISSYCAVSAIWSRIFLKEKLSPKHYIAISITFLGIVLLGIFSPV